MLDLELPTQAGELRPPFVHMGRHSDGARLVRDGALARLTNPPGCVCREFEALAPVELLGGAVEADDAFLDEVAERESASAVALGDRDDETEVRVDHALLGAAVTALDLLRELDLLGRREEIVLSDLVHEQGE